MNNIRRKTVFCYYNLRNYSTSQTPSIILSDACIKRIIDANKSVNKERFLRVIIGPGGCSGFMTEFKFDEEKKEEDYFFSQNGANVVVDDISLKYLNGSVVDWEETLAGSQFFIRDNPQAVNGCSCGVSFDIKDNEEEDELP